jgi:Chaperone of endosialidase
MSGSQLIPTNTFATQSGNIALSLLDTNFSQVASFLNNPNNYTNYLVDSGGANAYVVTFPTGVIPSSYTAGLTVVMKVANANTGASTLNVNSLGTKNILTPSGGALSSGTLAANAIVMVVYDGTQFILVGGSTSTTGTSIANGTSNVTIASSNGAITAATAGTTAVTIDTSQNVGIDQTSPTSKFVVGGGASAGSTNWGHFRGNCGASSPPSSDPYGVWFGSNYSNGNNEGNIAYNYALTTASWNGTTYTERMRIDSSGTVLIGKTSSSDTVAGIVLGNGSGDRVFTVGSSASWGVMVNRQGDDGKAINFRRANTDVGSINVTASATSYNTSSDYRLKENIAPMTGALAKVAQLKPVTYKWKIDGSDGEGFIAHELAEVCPHAVTGEKDAVDADGNPEYQGIDVSFLVATLTAAIQELKAINDTQAETITALTARVVALESK